MRQCVGIAFKKKSRRIKIKLKDFIENEIIKPETFVKIVVCKENDLGDVKGDIICEIIFNELCEMIFEDDKLNQYYKKEIGLITAENDTIVFAYLP